jgi:hypothetical protein
MCVTVKVIMQVAVRAVRNCRITVRILLYSRKRVREGKNDLRKKFGWSTYRFRVVICYHYYYNSTTVHSMPQPPTMPHRLVNTLAIGELDRFEDDHSRLCLHHLPS